MITKEKAQELLGVQARDTQGEELGTVAAIYVDDQTEKPEFAAISTESGSAIAPLVGAEEEDGALRFPYAADQVTAAPAAGKRQEGLTQGEEAELYAHYGLDYTVTVVDEDRIRLHRRANEQEVSGTVEDHHDVYVQRESGDGQGG